MMGPHMMIEAFVRSASERTSEMAASLLGEVGVLQEVASVEMSPSSVALEYCLREGRKRGAEWVMICDGDVLTNLGSVEQLVGQLGELESKDLVVISRVVDKLFGEIRTGGIRVYRSSVVDLLDAEVLCIGSTRPDSSLIPQMRQAGYRAMESSVVVGLHDYEQYYRDLYRKGYFHYVKHASFRQRLLESWTDQCRVDDDFLATLAGFADAMTGPLIEADVSLFDPDKIAQRLALLGLAEKRPDLDAMHIMTRVRSMTEGTEGSEPSLKSLMVATPVSRRLVRAAARRVPWRIVRVRRS